MNRSYKITTGVLFGITVIILPITHELLRHLVLPFVALFGTLILVIAAKKQTSKLIAKQDYKNKAVVITLYILATLLLVIAVLGFYAAYMIGPPVPN